MNFDVTKYKIRSWKNPAMLHWIINPGLAFNELVLGQRVPKITLIEKESRKPLPKRAFIPCPHCNTIHSEIKWSTQNGTAFKNWFGLYCDNCGKIIPCLWNFTSLIILAVTFPIWYWFKDQWKEKWLAKQKEKFSEPLNFSVPNFKWWHIGLSFALFFFIFERLIAYLIFKEEFIWKKLWGNAIAAIIIGLTFGYLAKGITKKRQLKK